MTRLYVPIHDIDEIHKRITHLVPIHHREQCRRRRLNGLKTRAARPEQRGAEDEEADVDGHGAHQDREGVAEPCEGEGGTFSVEVGRSVWVKGNGARLECEDTFLVFMFSCFTFSFKLLSQCSYVAPALKLALSPCLSVTTSVLYSALSFENHKEFPHSNILPNAKSSDIVSVNGPSPREGPPVMKNSVQ